LAQKTTRRVLLADEWRGLVILLMVFYHGVYDMVEIFGIDFPLFYSRWAHFLQVFIAGSFIILSGMCCRFSRNNLKRGALTFALGMVLTSITFFVLPSQIVRFGVLHLLGSAMFLFGLLRPLLDRIPTDWGAPLFGAIFLLVVRVPYREIGVPPFVTALPDALYTHSGLFWLGFPAAGFYSSDYFPLIPWLFLFLAGSYLGSYANEGRLPQAAYKSRFPWLAAVGQHTIWIYMFHQPVLYGLLLLLTR
jgi:uncharacterized membrane protein